MPLTLEVVGPKAAKMGARARKVFQGPGSIGRMPDNDWVLPDEYISGHHAKILFANGQYLIEDTSTNGVFINSPQSRMTRGQRYTLCHGDTVYIDDYEVRVTLDSESRLAPNPPPRAAPPIAADPFGADDLNAASAVDPMELLGLKGAPVIPSGPSAADLAGQSPIKQYYEPPPIPSRPQAPPPRPAPAPAPGKLIPDSYNPLAPDDSFAAERPATIAAPPPQPAAIPQPPPYAAPPRPSSPPPRAPIPARAPPLRPSPGRPQAEPAAEPSSLGPNTERLSVAPGANLDLATMLAAAGVDSAHVTPELAQQLGQILRVVVSGLMDVLWARQRIKEEFRIPNTFFKVKDHNPLKASVNVEDALHNLLVKRNPAFLGPVEAFEDAFQDVRNHQMAMLAGMRVAFDSMLANFDPARLQEKFERQVKGGFLAGSSKTKYWELYVDRFQDMVKDADSSFRHLFGDEFAKAYEKQLAEAKASSKPEGR